MLRKFYKANKIPLKPKGFNNTIAIWQYFETNCMNDEDYKALQNACGAIRRMLISSLKRLNLNKGLGLALDSICAYKCDAGSIRLYSAQNIGEYKSPFDRI